MNHHKQLLTIKEVSKRLNVKESWLRSKVFKREIPLVRLGRLIRFKVDEIENWIETKSNEGKQNEK